MTISKKTWRLVPMIVLATILMLWSGCSDDPTKPVVDDLQSADQTTDQLQAPLRVVSQGNVAPVRITKPYNPIDFRDGLVAESTANSRGIRTTLTDEDTGTIVAELIWTSSDHMISIDIPGYTSGSLQGHDDLPNFYGTNVALYYAYQEVMAAANGKAHGADKDEPGCDRIPDWLESTCMRACCAVHDACYAAETPPCTEKSWLGTEGLACALCNAEVVACMLLCKPFYVPDWVITQLWDLFQD